MPIQLSPERKAELDDYARRHGKDSTSALDEILASALEWERQDYREAGEGIRKGYESFKAGRTRPLEEAFKALRKKDELDHAAPRAVRNAG